MSERDDLYLEHVLQAIARIERFTSGGREVFVVDEMVQSAVIRQLEIVGEAVRNLSDELKARETADPRRVLKRPCTIHRIERINDQWRLCFVWKTEGVFDVEIVDYH